MIQPYFLDLGVNKYTKKEKYVSDFKINSYSNQDLHKDDKYHNENVEPNITPKVNVSKQLVQPIEIETLGNSELINDDLFIDGLL